MLRYVFIFLAAIAAWYFFVNHAADPVTTVAAPPPTPQAQFDKLFSESPVDAARLASLCSSYPQLGAMYLHGRQIQIRGTVAEVRTSGMEDRRADVFLDGEGPRRIEMVCDLDQYSGPAVNFRYLGKFQAVGTELLYLLQRERTLTKKVVVTQGAQVTQFCALKIFGESIIEFQMVNGPLWASAETNQE